MASRDDIYIAHILQAIERIQTYTEKLDYAKFVDDTLKQDAVIRQLEIIGEAAKNLSREFKDKVDLPWKDIMGMRDVAIHEYFDIDIETVWDTVVHDIPPLLQKLLPYKPAGPESQ